MDKFIRQLMIQFRIIRALMLREALTRYGRHNIGVLWIFIEPMMFTVLIVIVWTFLKIGHNNSIPIVPFGVTGYSGVLLWRNMPSRTMGAVEPNLSLMYHRNVTLLDVYIARVALEAVGATMSFFVLSLLFHSWGWMILPENLLMVLGGWLLLMWFGAVFAISVGALTELSEYFEKLWHPVLYLLFPVSGAMFMVDWLPSRVQSFVLMLPMVHGLEMIRGGYFGSSVHTHYSIVFMVIANIVLTYVGLSATAKLSREITPE